MARGKKTALELKVEAEQKKLAQLKVAEQAGLSDLYQESVVKPGLARLFAEDKNRPGAGSNNISASSSSFSGAAAGGSTSSSAKKVAIQIIKRKNPPSPYQNEVSDAGFEYTNRICLAEEECSPILSLRREVLA